MDTTPWKVRDWFDEPGDGNAVMKNDIVDAADKLLATFYHDVRPGGDMLRSTDAEERAALVVRLINWWKMGIAYRDKNAAEIRARGGIPPDLDHGIPADQIDVCHMMNGLMLEAEAMRAAAEAACTMLDKIEDCLDSQTSNAIAADHDCEPADEAEYPVNVTVGLMRELGRTLTKLNEVLKR